MKVEIGLLKDHTEHLDYLGSLWYDLLGRRWPDTSPVSAVTILKERLNYNSLPITMVAFINNFPVGMCSLWERDEIEPRLGPWLGTLIVEPSHQRKGIGRILVNSIKSQAKNMGYKILYLYTGNVAEYYSDLGWLGIRQVDYKGNLVEIMKIKL